MAQEQTNSYDAPFHQAGDGRLAAIVDGGYWGEDYISVGRLRSALVASNVVPIFAVTKDVVGIYADLVEQLGVGAVVPLTSNPRKLMGAIADVVPGDLVGMARGTVAGNLHNHVTYI